MPSKSSREKSNNFRHLSNILIPRIHINRHTRLKSSSPSTCIIPSENPQNDRTTYTTNPNNHSSTHQPNPAPLIYPKPLLHTSHQPNTTPHISKPSPHTSLQSNLKSFPPIHILSKSLPPIPQTTRPTHNRNQNPPPTLNLLLLPPQNRTRLTNLLQQPSQNLHLLRPKRQKRHIRFEIIVRNSEGA